MRKFTMKSMFNPVASVVACALAFATSANASVISVSDSDDSSGYSIGSTHDRSVFAASFSLGADYSDFSIAAEVACFDCVGSFTLHSKSIGATASLTDAIDGFAIDSVASPFGSTLGDTDLFSGSFLGAGDYFLIFAITSGTGAWASATTPIVAADTGNSVNFQFQADSVSPFPFNSLFDPILSLTELAEFSVDGTLVEVETVPLPAGGLMLGSALFGAMAIKRIRRRKRPR